nr:P-loop NTPase fold protein [uncultured Allomuricauda sp.]
MKINFIPDEVLKLTDSSDILGTKPYSETIFEIVKKCDGSKNIGLFGSWGSGKSTILRTLENLIEQNNTKKTGKIAYFEFDAWKYSQDDFRRSFLIELTRTFKISYESKLKKLLYNESSFEDPEQTKYSFNWLNLPNWILFFLVVFGFWFYFQNLIAVNQDIRAVISLLSITISLLSTATSKIVNAYKVVVKESKIVEPERFEAIFDEVITEVTTKRSSTYKVYKWILKKPRRTKYSKVVIVIDNLDRCDDENLMETLNTVKNFLEHKRVIFILPVDEKGISSFLSQKTDNADEYLRKIFHLIIRLKEFSNKELLEFTNSLNDNYDLKLTNSSIRIICQEFTNNPRKIIQFLNNYQSEIWLTGEQSKKSYIDGNVIKNNHSFFIKLLIIKYEWKDLYDEILHDKTLLNKINQVITNLKPDENELYPIVKTNIRLTDSQRNFLFSTQDIHCSKIEPFVLNIDLDKDLPDDIENFIRQDNYQELVNYLQDENISLDEEKLLQKMDEVFADLTYKHQEYEFIAIPTLKLLIDFVLDDKQDDFRSVLKENHKDYPFLNSLFRDTRLDGLLEKFDFKRLNDTTKWFLENINDDLFKSLASHVSTRFFGSSIINDENERIDYFIETFKNTGKLSIIKKEFSNKINGRPEGVSKIESIKDYKIASQIISNPTYKSLSSKLNDSDTKGTYRLAKLCSDYTRNNEKDKVSRKHIIRYYLTEMVEFYSSDSITESVYTDYKSYFTKLNELLTTGLNLELSDAEKNTLTYLNNYFFQNYIPNFNEEKHYELYESFFEFAKNLMFYAKNYNSISYRTDYFDRYLKKDYSSKVSLKINKILLEDVENFATYDYPFATTLIILYSDAKKPNIPYGKTLIRMVEKTDDENGLIESDIESIILRTINVFAHFHNKESISLIKRLKNPVGNQFLKVLNNDLGIYTESYIKNVKLLEDSWFYGDAILNYLKKPIQSKEAKDYHIFRGKLSTVVNYFSVEETNGFIQNLIDEIYELTVYKWLRKSYKILSTQTYDVYLDNLINAHRNGIVRHNDFFEWIIDIPKESFSENRKDQFKEYINKLGITHKTYVPKKDNALSHLSS